MNAVRFGSLRCGAISIILSGSTDATIRIWSSCCLENYDFSASVVVKGHAGSINCLAFNVRRGLLVSGAADGTVKAWLLTLDGKEIHWSLAQTIQTSPQLYPLTLALSDLGYNGDLLLAVAGTKGVVQIYVANEDKPDFQLQANLVGHENWVRSLAITPESEKACSDLLLASASQDKYIRLWRIRQDISASSAGPSVKRDFMSSLSNKAHRLVTSQTSYLLTFEALLLGHEDWIYTVQWHLTGSELRLLSASADNSLAIWKAEESSGIWLCKTRLGEISSQKGSTTATGSTGGFWIGLWSLDGKGVVSLGRTGSWRLWNHAVDSWTQGLGVTGHTGPITGIAWAKDGTYLLSTGSDQTTRLHADWKRGTVSTWHEFARPQIHGYDLNCIDSIGTSQFISGADEKSLRVFDEPRTAAELLKRLSGIALPADASLPDAANIPVLGLSNKAVDSLDNHEPLIDGDAGGRDAPDPASTLTTDTLDLDHPPIEDQLARHTLWPEREKLYGHGYEISAVATSHDGSIIATACKASSIDHAVIRLYETSDWREVKPALTSHTLTVTCLRFSEDDRYLLSVGRDRQWAVFARDAISLVKFTLAASNPKGHTRMILHASWAPDQAGRMFATAARDKVVKLWRLPDQEGTSESKCITTMGFSTAVTAIDIVPRIIDDKMVAAIGTEDGGISISTLNLLEIRTYSTYKLDEV